MSLNNSRLLNGFAEQTLQKLINSSLEAGFPKKHIKNTELKTFSDALNNTLRATRAYLHSFDPKLEKISQAEKKFCDSEEKFIGFFTKLAKAISAAFKYLSANKTNSLPQKLSELLKSLIESRKTFKQTLKEKKQLRKINNEYNSLMERVPIADDDSPTIAYQKIQDFLDRKIFLTSSEKQVITACLMFAYEFSIDDVKTVAQIPQSSCYRYFTSVDTGGVPDKYRQTSAKIYMEENQGDFSCIKQLTTRLKSLFGISPTSVYRWIKGNPDSFQNILPRCRAGK